MQRAVITEAGQNDAEGILALQKLAYLSEAELYGEDQVPPLRQSLAEMQADLTSMCVLKAMRDGRLVGSVRAREKNGVCLVGRLIVHPDARNLGMGTALMRAIEDRFPKAERYELFTGHKSAKNLHLYEKLGYVCFREQPVSDRLTLVFLRKTRQSRATGEV